VEHVVFETFHFTEDVGKVRLGLGLWRLALLGNDGKEVTANWPAVVKVSRTVDLLFVDEVAINKYAPFSRRPRIGEIDTVRLPLDKQLP